MQLEENSFRRSPNASRTFPGQKELLDNWSLLSVRFGKKSAVGASLAVLTPGHTLRCHLILPIRGGGFPASFLMLLEGWFLLPKFSPWGRGGGGDLNMVEKPQNGEYAQE